MSHPLWSSRHVTYLACFWARHSGSTPGGRAPARGEVTITPVGTPYLVVDTHLYTAPAINLSPALFPDFPNHFPTRLQHAPPYDQEFADALAIAGYAEKEVFSVEEFSSPNAVHFGFVVVPGTNAPNGSSLDFDSGPIIPNDIFPIAYGGDVYLNGALYEQNAWGNSVPALDGFDGRSHFLVDLWENSEFAPPGLGSLVGDYEYRITLRDVNNFGYDIVATFQVVPEPGTSDSVRLGGNRLGRLRLAATEVGGEGTVGS